MTAPSAPPDRGRKSAAWTLALLTTLCAELTFTAVAVPFVWLILPLLMVMYGAGVLLVREATVRVGGDWPTLVLLGLVYQLAEDGLGLQALTSPKMYGAADWGWRALGVNWTYWESQIGVHVVFSVLIPVLLTDLLFPSHRGRPYLRTGGLIGTAALAVLGVFGLRFAISATEHPGYQTPWWAVAIFLAGMAALAVIALRVLPRAAVPKPKPASTAPKPVVVALATGIATFAFLALLLPPGLVGEPILSGFIPLPILLVIAALVGVVSAWMVLRWSASGGWRDQHRIWLAGGILVAHTAFMMPSTLTAIITGAIVIALEILLLMTLARLVKRRENARDARNSIS